MMRSLFLSIIVLFVNSCGNSNRLQGRAEDISAATTALCFLRVSGTANQDTSFVYLVIHGTKVDGKLDVIPFEKDSRKGILKGSRNGNMIQADWFFMQEGFRDTLPLEFQLHDNYLLQKPYSVNPQTGKQFLSDTTGFTLKYQLVTGNSCGM